MKAISHRTPHGIAGYTFFLHRQFYLFKIFCKLVGDPKISWRPKKLDPDISTQFPETPLKTNTGYSTRVQSQGLTLQRH